MSSLQDHSQFETNSTHQILANKPVVIWLLSVSALILLMVALGGATRLTGSGLSMVDWRLIGNLPPMSETAWLELFERYKQFPQYQLVNYHMSVHDFKEIFWWEYLHRMLGRLIGMAFAIPWIVFLISKKVRFKSHLNLKLGIAFVLGGTQAFIGWYMVKSGLVNIPSVSHLRLTTHLCTAFIIIGFLTWVALTELWPATQRGFKPQVPKWLRKASLVLPFLLLFQIAYGGLNAGLKAGYVFTDFPLMFGYLIPPQTFQGEGFWHSLIFDVTTVHFIHRTFAWILFFGVLTLWWKGVSTLKKQTSAKHQIVALRFLAIGIVGQFLLGIATVLTKNSIHPALSHQVWGCILFLSSIYFFQQLRR